MSRTIAEIAETLGMQTAVRLSRVYGGRTLRVPIEVDQLHPLSVALGFEAAQRFVREYRGVCLDVPAEQSALLVLRNQAIVAAHRGGASIHGLAAANQLSRKMIRNILRKAGVEMVPPANRAAG